MGEFIHCQAFSNRTFSTCKRSLIWNVFASKAHACPEGWRLWYGDGPAGVLYLDDEDDVSGFSILRAGRACFDDFVILAAQIPSLIYWNNACAVADPGFLPGIPDYLLDAFERPPAIVHSGCELVRVMEES